MLELFSGAWTTGDTLKVIGLCFIITGLGLIVVAAMFKVNLLYRATALIVLGAGFLAVGVGVDTDAMITTR